MRGSLAATETPILPSVPLANPRMRRNLRPMRAAVGRFIETAAGSAARELPRHALRLPHGGVENARILGIHRQVDAAGRVVDVEDLAPRHSAVGGFENAALGVRLEHVSHGGCVDDVGIARIDGDLGDHVRVAKPGIRPRLAGVGRLVDAVAGVEIAANVGFAGAGVDDVGIRRRDGERADRIGDPRDLSVGNVGPAQAVVGAPPDAALDAAHIKEVRLRSGTPATATERPPMYGPMLRQLQFAHQRCDGRWRAAEPTAAGRKRMTRTSASEKRFMRRYRAAAVKPSRKARPDWRSGKTSARWRNGQL